MLHQLRFFTYKPSTLFVIMQNQNKLSVTV